MLKKILSFVKKIILGFLFIYAFNKLGVTTNMLIPLNFITVFLVGILGIPALIILIMFSIIYV